MSFEENACALCDCECAYLDDACACLNVRESVRMSAEYVGGDS